jgi:hypothetical protein
MISPLNSSNNLNSSKALAILSEEQNELNKKDSLIENTEAKPLPDSFFKNINLDSNAI